jgi:hypothetical protein
LFCDVARSVLATPTWSTRDAVIQARRSMDPPPPRIDTGQPWVCDTVKRVGRRLIVLVGVVLGAVGIAGLAEGCRAPTQATIEVTTSAQCSELGEVAIVVSGAQEESEMRAARGFYAAEASHCDPATRSFGTLVVVPGGSRAAVIVLAAPTGHPLSECVPPRYPGCIVVRRGFGFIDNASLTIPAPLDVECRDVPCDAFTTCKKGVCLSAEVACESPSACHLVGETPNGDLAPDAEVFSDGSTYPDGALVPRDGAITDGYPGDGPIFDTGTDGPILDTGTDGPILDAGTDGSVNPPPGNVTCNGGMMQCGAFSPCVSTMGCCENIMAVDSLTCTAPTNAPCTGLVKGRQRYCCSDAWCASYVDTTHCTVSAGPTAGNCVLP